MRPMPSSPAPDERAAAPTGHPRPRGALLPKPEALARDDRERWRTCEADLYDQRRTVRYKEMSTQCIAPARVCIVRIVIVPVTTGVLDRRENASPQFTGTTSSLLSPETNTTASSGLLAIATGGNNVPGWSAESGSGTVLSSG
jgi:hypothetical protein